MSAARDVVGQVAEAEGGAAEVFESAVDGLGRAVGRAGSVEVGQHVSGALFQCSAESTQFGQSGRDAVADH